MMIENGNKKTLSVRDERKKQGARIRAERKKQGFTLKTMSEMLGCSEQAVSQYELGTRPIKSDMLEKIANVLQVPVQSFFHEAAIIFEQQGDFAETLWKEHEEKLARLSEFLLQDDNVEDAYRLITVFSQLNNIGKKRLLEYAGDMRSIFKYCKTKEQMFPGFDFEE